MCTGSCHTAEQTEKLFKNLSVDFQKIRQRQRISGVATEQPALRNSHELYIAFDQYFALYFPQGGSTVPPFVMTEKSVSIFSESAASDFLGETSGSTSTFSPQPSASTSQLQPSASDSRPVSFYIPRPNFARKRKAPTTDPTTDLLSSMVKMQNRQLQLDRERNRIEREKLQSLLAIQGELSTIRATLCHIAGVTLQPIWEE